MFQFRTVMALAVLLSVVQHQAVTLLVLLARGAVRHLPVSMNAALVQANVTHAMVQVPFGEDMASRVRYNAPTATVAEYALDVTEQDVGDGTVSNPNTVVVHVTLHLRTYQRLNQRGIRMTKRQLKESIIMNIKKKSYWSLLAIMMVAVMNMCFVSCSKDDDDNDEIVQGNDDISDYESSIINKLKGTSWKWVRNDIYHDGVFNRSVVGDNSIIKFSDEQTSNKNEFYMYAHGIKSGTWMPWLIVDGDFILMINWDSAEDAASYGRSKLFTLTATELVMGTDVIRHCFVAANSSSGSGYFGGEAPSFTSFSYTYTSTSVTVLFYTDVDITDGIVYYGASTATSPVSSAYTIVGRRMVQATIRNLRRSTKYYVKCTVKNKYGSKTSDDFSVMTGQ